MCKNSEMETAWYNKVCLTFYLQLIKYVVVWFWFGPLEKFGNHWPGRLNSHRESLNIDRLRSWSYAKAKSYSSFFPEVWDSLLVSFVLENLLSSRLFVDSFSDKTSTLQTDAFVTKHKSSPYFAAVEVWSVCRWCSSGILNPPGSLCSSEWGLTKPQISNWCSTWLLVPRFPSLTNIFITLANGLLRLELQKQLHKSTQRNQGWARPQCDDSAPYLTAACCQKCGC